ncbi:hypothetical protein LSCM1_04457 [Leishmania martiniquensis]|uniref:REH2 DRSM domain-containing protein n=1 Tax=Leishmania martiniquensis TaxID=1580590 RepID=A0A836KH14_9TRYP|nr:hypothetical protein LSCM1_04457 [Leishmania martiniquensis]
MLRLVHSLPMAYASVSVQRRSRSSSSQRPLSVTSIDSTRVEGGADDWSDVEVEVLLPEPKVAASGSSTISSTANDAAAPALEAIDAIDSYAKAKVSNFVRRLLPPSAPGASGAAPSSSVIGLEVRQVQGCGKTTQYHARWRLPLPAEFGERYGEGFAPTAKEAEAVAAMHAERVIDALGFQLFQLSSKQRKHAEAARAAGRWAPMPEATTSSSTASSSGTPVTSAEVVPPPDTPSPPPLQLLELSARERQEKDLRIDRIQFIPVQRTGFAPFAFTLASPHHLDSSSHARIERFFRIHRTPFKSSLRLILLKSSRNGAASREDVGEDVNGRRNSATPQDVFLAQLILPLPARFGKRVAMGKASTRREAVLVACMHAELIIDAVGFALYPDNHEHQAAHAVECARMHRWCTQPGDCTYKYTAPSPPPMELVEEPHPSTVAPATMVTPERGSAASGVPLRVGAEDGITEVDGDGRNFGASPSSKRASEAQACSTPPSVESMLLQHQRAILAVRNFTDEPSLRDFEPARLLLERYVEPFVPRLATHAEAAARTSSISPTDSCLTALMLVEEMGQRDRRVFRATITVPLSTPSCEQAAQTSTPAPAAPEAASDTAQGVDIPSALPYTHSFVAIGVSYTIRLAESAAAVHALRTLAALNRLCLVHGNAAVVQALESFAMRAQIPLHDPAQPMLIPAQLPPQSLPAPVRVMEGFVGRIAASGLKLRDRRYLPTDMNVEIASSRFASRIPLLSEEAGTVACTLNREDDLLRELRVCQERLPRLQWDASPDADGRIIVSPDLDVRQSPTYNHTLPSIREPDVMATTRLRDYLERHGKSLELALSVVRVDDHPANSARHAFYVARVVLPVALRHRSKAKRKLPSADVSATGALASSPPAFSESPQSGPLQVSEYVAQGEGPTRDDAILLCAAHAEVLLDSAGLPFYDHALLQRKHADTARALGRWAPLVRGAASPPGALCRTPPPLRKVARESPAWACAQAQRCASAREALMSESVGPATPVPSPALPTRIPHSAPAAPAGATKVDDETLCDIARLQFVYHTDIDRRALRMVAEYFLHNGSDIHRMVRQYVVKHPKLGTIYRSIVEIPLPASYGKRYAVGCAAQKRQALFLCCKHALLILDALSIPVFNQYGRQRKYSRAAAVKGHDVPLGSKAPRKTDTPSPPGLYYLATCAAAKEKPPDVPKLPCLRDRKVLALWGIFVHHCASYVTRISETWVKEAVSAPVHPRVPRSNLVAENAALEMADKMPSDKFARRRLLELCRMAGLPDPTEDTPSQAVALSPNERRFVTFKELVGTPYTMRGVSDVTPAESRYRAYEHGIQLLLLVVRPNSSSVPTPRRSWWDGQQRTLCIYDSVRNQITPHGCLWLLRMWAAMHNPPLCVRVEMRRLDSPSEELGNVHARADDSSAAAISQLTPALPAHGPAGPLISYEGVAFITQLCDGNEKVLYHAACETTDPATTASAADSVHKALRQLLSDVQRAPTMQRLHRFLSQQPQLHIPSFRVLADPEEVVHRLHAQVCDAHKSTRTAQPIKPLEVGHLTARWTALTPHEEQTVSFYTSWCVEALQRWVGSASGAGGSAVATEGETESVRAQPKCLPSTLVSLLTSYGLARAAPRARMAWQEQDATSRPPSPGVPTPLAGALAVLCRCLPELPDVTEGEEKRKGAAVGQAPPSMTRLVERHRELPLQLAHLILMGMLLGCVPWAVRAAALVACAEHTLEWYDQQQLSHAAAGSSAASAPTPPPPSSRSVPYVSVDVTEAVLASLDATVPPLPKTVLRYASEVEQRLKDLWMEASAAAEAEGASPLPWLQSLAAWSACLEKTDVSGQSSTSPDALTATQRGTLRPLLQCAVSASAAPHAVWVRAVRVERGADAEEAGGDSAYGSLAEPRAPMEPLIFQSRRSAHYAAVRLSTSNPTQVEPAKAISAMTTCFAAFGCYAYPKAALVATTLEQERASASWSVSRAAEDDDSTAQTSNDGEKGAAEAVKDGEEEEDRDDLDDDGDVDVGQYVRVFGTCVSPLAAALVAAAPTRSASLPLHSSTPAKTDDTVVSGALRAVDENLPMLMTAFQETVPLLVNRHTSVPLLSGISAHLRSRVEATTPFSPEERNAISELFRLAVGTAADAASRGEEAV